VLVVVPPNRIPEKFNRSSRRGEFVCDGFRLPRRRIGKKDCEDPLSGTLAKRTILPLALKRVRDIPLFLPVKFKVVKQLVSFTVGLLRPRHGVIVTSDQLVGDLHAQKAVMVI
jgi:hypothetical protein